MENPERVNTIRNALRALEIGMVFNVEPAIYINGYGGIRHCDMVAVTGEGAGLLTPFQCRAKELTTG